MSSRCFLPQVLFTGAGFVFGNIPVVQHNFTLVVLGIVAVSVVPVIYEVIQAGKEKDEDSPASDAPAS
jgi:membrane-associated protein